MYSRDMEQGAARKLTAFASRSDLAERFISERTYQDDLILTKATDIHQAFIRWLVNNPGLVDHPHMITPRQVGELMKQHVFSKRMRAGVFYNIGLKED